ncbi:MAG TPA: YtxH domain-containing protein [Candidatus Eisenbacteria bacterium]|jgi:gas vesicle protein|nr:YtxH domain-containing protein [Candidatus Eisenbacteria bacterium]
MYELQQSDNQMTRKAPPAGSLVMGALVGAGIALLLAPATGKDVRQRLGHTAKKIGGNAKGVIGKARQTLNGIKEDARASVERGVGTFEQSRSVGPSSRMPAG